MESTRQDPPDTQASAEVQSFNQFYIAQQNSPTLRTIFRTGTGIQGLPDAILPYSFVTLEDLAHIQKLLQLTPGQTLADVACGNGSLGLWLAKCTQAQLVGVDYSEAAIEVARQKSAALSLDASSKFIVGNFDHTGIESASVDAVVSIDAIWLAADQQQALHEIARILRHGAKFVFTSWEQHIPMPMIKKPVKDYRPLLEAAGFAIEHYEYLYHSEAVMKDIYAQIRNSQAQLVTELGEAARGLIGEAHFVPGLIDGVNYISPENGPHVLVAARRKPQ